MKFDFSKIKNFDNHIKLSIPDYDSLSNIFKHLALRYADTSQPIVDLGCSTGRFLLSLKDHTDQLLMGVDEISTHMPNDVDNVKFIDIDANQFFRVNRNQQFSVIVSMFFLQFLNKQTRRSVLEYIEEQVRGGATLLISEKVYLPDVKLHQAISRLHIQNKREKFSDTEILDKEKAMEDSMFCVVSTELENELKQMGKVSKVWQSYNFMGYVVRRHDGI